MKKLKGCVHYQGRSQKLNDAYGYEDPPRAGRRRRHDGPQRHQDHGAGQGVSVNFLADRAFTRLRIGGGCAYLAHGVGQAPLSHLAQRREHQLPRAGEALEEGGALAQHRLPGIPQLLRRLQLLRLVRGGGFGLAVRQGHGATLLLLVPQPGTKVHDGGPGQQPANGEAEVNHEERGQREAELAGPGVRVLKLAQQTGHQAGQVRARTHGSHQPASIICRNNREQQIYREVAHKVCNHCS
eukprot:CAMPEP_0181419902 /NCGR_PEP_ID=MMETSP1110-20121109/12311_1 /TAXON_ID=174948 /ORGANISM="Symbiodinium sp., Strain CCMP421" /LENGTH=239 /DNA_ID=CAMNT_0023542929 /DNA_START=208 /DNA_END=928 /DNA_ORIENTATION=+